MFGWKKRKKEKHITNEIITLHDMKKKRNVIHVVTGTSVFELETIKITRTEFNKKKETANEMFSNVPLSKYIKSHKNARLFLLQWLGKSEFSFTGAKLFSGSATSRQLEKQTEEFLHCLTQDIIFKEFYEQKKREAKHAKTYSSKLLRR